MHLSMICMHAGTFIPASCLQSSFIYTTVMYGGTVMIRWKMHTHIHVCIHMSWKFSPSELETKQQCTKCDQGTHAQGHLNASYPRTWHMMVRIYMAMMVFVWLSSNREHEQLIIMIVPRSKNMCVMVLVWLSSSREHEQLMLSDSPTHTCAFICWAPASSRYPAFLAASSACILLTKSLAALPSLGLTGSTGSSKRCWSRIRITQISGNAAMKMDKEAKVKTTIEWVDSERFEPALLLRVPVSESDRNLEDKVVQNLTRSNFDGEKETCGIPTE
jgi:hypothetical protein